MAKYVLIDQYSVPDADYTVEKKIMEDNGIECQICNCRTDDEVVAVAGDADGIGVIYYNMHADLIKRLPNCKLMVRYGVGYDCIDVEQATKQGIMVCNLPDYCMVDVATHTMALILDLARKTTMYDRYVRSGKWNDIYGYPTHRLDSMTLGFMGFGRLAQSTAKYAKAFEMKMIAYDPYLPDAVFEEMGVKKVSLDDLYGQADILSIHMPLTAETRHMINDEAVAKMKDGIMIVNTARGPIIDNEALYKGLKSGKIKAAGLDVIDGEPITDPNFPLFEFESVVVTQHSAYYSVESGREQHEKVGYTMVDAFVKKVMPYNCVNKKQLQR